jgi:hypothetical protein
MKHRKKKSRKLSDYPKNVPRALIREYRLLGENQLQLARKLGVNDAHLSKLFKYGVEPVDSDIRKRLMLSIHPICRCCGRKIINRTKSGKKQEPEFVKEWKHLPTEERRKAMKEYITWRRTKRNRS